ncbi:MAG: AAA family ATPase [Lachnospiraceae bacterium]|nr:AAA family ATPase [Lachnospiraceae bacterium]
MNTKKYMIILKNEIRTKEVVSCKYNPNSQKWDVVFDKNSKVFSYGYSNVQLLKEPKVLNPSLFRISRAGKTFFDVQEIYVFYGKGNAYWHICFGNGSERDYAQNELNINKSCLTDAMSNNVFEYLKQISKLSDLRNKDTGEKILEKRYEKLTYIDEKLALARYLNPTNGQKMYQKDIVPIFPFGCNKSQYRAVKNALQNQISVIQGPPGTGKTQTILNIIANILMQGKTVQIVSNNNAAIENVYEKLSSPKYNLEFLVASLGNVENKKRFIENQDNTYPKFSDWLMQESGLNSLEEVRKKSEQLGVIFEKQERLACLKQELAQLELEQKYFEKYLSETNVNIDSIRIGKKISSKQFMELWQKCQGLSESNKKLGFVFRLKSIFLYGISDWTFYKQDISKIITAFQGLFLKYKRMEIMEEINVITEYFHNVNVNLLNDMCNQSMAILKDTLARRYGKKVKRTRFSEDDLWKNSQAVLMEYPVVLSTTFSSRTSLNSSVEYDYLIMDEASQVDIATGALALSCAKNAVIVGDTKQLPNVVKEEVKKRSGAIFQGFNISKGYQFTKSFLQSVLDVIPDVTQVLLREHYRCHPKIINFCNQKFYNGELIIMTDDSGEENVLMAMKTVVGNHEREHYSQRQIDVIKNEVLSNLQPKRNEIGIITPYKNQVQAMKKQLEGIDVSTVHKFQGREKDTIIISTVDDEISDFADDPYLLNVAVSRAKKKLILVVSGNEQSPEKNISDLTAYIQYNNFQVQESKIYSVFDYLYKQYTEARKRYIDQHKKISEYDSENLMYGLISDILSVNAYTGLDVISHFLLNMLIRNYDLLNDRECKYAMHPATHLDFLIYNRISKLPILALEVDGYDFHKPGTVQSERDKLKNHILELYDIPLLRFHTNGSGEKEVIEAKLAELACGERLSACDYCQ